MKAFLIIIVLLLIVSFARSPYVYIKGIKNLIREIKRKKSFSIKRSTELFNKKVNNGTDLSSPHKF